MSNQTKEISMCWCKQNWGNNRTDSESAVQNCWFGIFRHAFFLLQMSWRMWFLHQMHLPYRWTDVVVKVILNESTHNAWFPHACVLWLWEKQKHWNIMKYKIYDQWPMFKCLSVFDTHLQTMTELDQNYVDIKNLRFNVVVVFLQYVISEVCILYTVWNKTFCMYKIPGWHTFAITHSIWLQHAVQNTISTKHLKALQFLVNKCFKLLYAALLLFGFIKSCLL